MDEGLSTAQRLLRAILPGRWFEQIEAESREWIMTCSQCGAQRSIWDAGGVRWKAKGERVFHARCTSCRRGMVHRMKRQFSLSKTA